MFDIGFWELMIIGILGLVVLGPERLPVAIRTVRGWMNSVRQFSQNVQTELKEELRIHELHENLKKAEQQGLKNLSPEIESSLTSLKEAAEAVTRPYLKDDKTEDTDSPAIEESENHTSVEQETTKQAPVKEETDSSSKGDKTT